MDLTITKAQFAEDTVELARETLKIAQKWDSLNQSYNAHGFNPGGAHEFEDKDFQTPIPPGSRIPANPQFTAQIMADVLFAIGTLSNEANPGLRNALFECIPGGIP